MYIKTREINTFKQLIGIALVITMLMTTIAPVFAHENIVEQQQVDTDEANITVNQITEIRPELGPDDPNAVIGENGYKVFHPGAIKTATVSIDPSEESESNVNSVARTGSTDAWLAWSWSWDWQKFGWEHRGSHLSQSTIWESEIRVDGYLKVTIDPGWRDDCNSPGTSGNYRHCVTAFFQLIPRTITAESHHFFHTPGYANSSFITQDNA